MGKWSLFCVCVPQYSATSTYVIVIIIINIQGWAIWPVLSPELQLLSPSLLRCPNCSLSLWAVEVWFQGDSVLWHSLYVCEPVPSVIVRPSNNSVLCTSIQRVCIADYWYLIVTVPQNCSSLAKNTQNNRICVWPSFQIVGLCIMVTGWGRFCLYWH
jgi:hypothetical protein